MTTLQLVMAALFTLSVAMPAGAQNRVMSYQCSETSAVTPLRSGRGFNQLRCDGLRTSTVILRVEPTRTMAEVIQRSGENWTTQCFYSNLSTSIRCDAGGPRFRFEPDGDGFFVFANESGVFTNSPPDASGSAAEARFSTGFCRQ